MIEDASIDTLAQPFVVPGMTNEKDYIRGVELIAMAAYEARKDRVANILFCMVNLLRTMENSNQEK